MASRDFHRSRYGRYDGGPDPLAAPVDLREALDAIGQEVMEGTSARRALQEFLRRGTKNQRGLDKLREQVAKKRQELLQKHNLDGTMREVRELLDHAVLEERKQLARDLDDEARFAEMQIESLSPSAAQAVNELKDYNWRSSTARQDYEKIKDLLGREMLDQRFKGMKQALENATDEDRERVTEMLRDLNSLLAAHNSGADTGEQFTEFMNKHGEFFPENPKTIDELIDLLAQRAAAAQRMRNSMTQQQRDELDALAQQAFGSPDLMSQLSQLDSQLQSARPGEDWNGSQEFSGEQGMGLGDGTGAFQDIAELESLSEQLSQQQRGASLDDIDLDTLARQLGDEAAVDAATLRDLDKALKDTGLLDRSADGDLRLSPKAMRRLGESILRDVAKQLSSRGGQRDMHRAGASGERTGASREWEFGDTEPWDVTRTLTNAVIRRAAEGSAGGPLRIGMSDVEVSETEARTQAAVALLVDTSFSMIMDGRWVPMKRTALALHQLVTTKFRNDSLELISFGPYARSITIEELTAMDGEYEKGTNFHHGLLLAGRHFRKHPNAQPVLLVVTDGEPTSHLMGDGSMFFDYPPHPLTVAKTVREFDEVARLGAQTTIFQLGEHPALTQFLADIARRIDGKVVNPELDDLGAAVVGNYLSARMPRFY